MRDMLAEMETYCVAKAKPPVCCSQRDYSTPGRCQVWWIEYATEHFDKWTWGMVPERSRLKPDDEVSLTGTPRVRQTETAGLGSGGCLCRVRWFWSMTIRWCGSRRCYWFRAIGRDESVLYYAWLVKFSEVKDWLLTWTSHPETDMSIFVQHWIDASGSYDVDSMQRPDMNSRSVSRSVKYGWALQITRLQRYHVWALVTKLPLRDES